MIALTGIEKRFGENVVLRGVELRVEKGTVHALLGENGAGKSTCMKILLGIETPSGGSMSLDGKPYAPSNPAEARRLGVVMVPQERTLAPHLTIAENIVLGMEPSRFGIVLRKEARAMAGRALTMVSDRLSLDARADSLSSADQQLVEIARALAQAGETAKVLVLDEPTSSLGQDDAARLFERVAALRERGLAIVLVTHFLGDVRAHADRYTVLRDGKVAGEGDPKVVPAEVIVREMLGRELLEVAEVPSAATDDVALRVKEGDIAFEVKRGEIFGIAGLVGSGRTRLLRLIAAHASDQRIGLLSEDRGGEGLMLARSIADNVWLSSHGPFFVRPATTEKEGQKWIAELAIKARGPRQSVAELSGGNQQKVQIARMLREDYDVLLVDEPTRGIDVASKAQVLELLRALAKKGKAIVLVSSQLDELVKGADRIGVLAKGRLGAARSASEWTEESLLLEAAS